MNIKRAALLAIGLITAYSSAPAQVYKCPQPDGRASYQDAPCVGQPSKQVRVETGAPSVVDQAAAERRAQDERRRLAEIESEREYNKRLAQVERDEATKAAQKRARKCAEYVNRAAYLEERSTTWYTEKFKNQDLAEARYIRNQHFSECGGSK